jgi:imidazolonepropionase-like amidohydrolase
MESYDAIPENMVIVDAAKGGCAIVHSDSDEGIQRLNQEAGKGIASAARAGITITPEHAIRWLTQNPARALGIADKTGTLEVGKAADLVVWNGSPFSSYALTEQVFIDGARRFDRGARRALPESDFMLGQPAAPGVSP